MSTPHDLDWDMPFPRFGPASSFVAPVEPPSVEPDGGTLVQIPCVALEWLPFLLGALDQLRNPATWDVADDDAMMMTLQRVANLRDLIAQWGACEVLAFRCEPGGDMSPQYSTDGGTTWIDLPDCFIGPPGTNGTNGTNGVTPQLRWSGCSFQVSTDGGATWANLSGFTIPTLAGCLPGSPGNPQGVSVPVQACNIAAWLAEKILLQSLSTAATNITGGSTLIAAGVALMALAVSLSGVGAVAWAAVGFLFEGAGAVGATTLNTAAADATLKANLKCAIYTAILADGSVTASNFAAVHTAIAAISYSVPAVVGLMADYFNNLGYEGIAQIQAEGALYIGDCSACGTWCFEWDNAGHAALNLNWVPYTPPGTATFSAGVWHAVFQASTWTLYLQVPLDPTRTYTDASFVTNAGSAGRGWDIRFYSGAVGSTVLASAAGSSTSSPSWSGSVTGAHTLLIDMVSTSGAFTLSQITLRGPGPCPFGVSNCM